MGVQQTSMIGQVVAVVLLLAHPLDGFYLPGVAPREFRDGDRVDVKVNKLTAKKNPLPYDYYSLPFCQPKEVVHVAENIGEVLQGSVIQNSGYDVEMMRSGLKVLCVAKFEEQQMKQFSRKIRQGYRVHMIIDNLPVATKMVGHMADGEKVYLYERGFPIGFVGNKKIPGTSSDAVYIFNHLNFVIKFHRDPSFEGARIVGFEMEPTSVSFTSDSPSVLTAELPPQTISSVHNKGGKVVFTYDVRWEESPIRWASRWDMYLYMGQDDIHWFSILNSLVMLILLTFIVATILIRTLRRDLNKYETDMDKENLQEESGWKLLHGDVLRPPPNVELLSASVGVGLQMFGCVAVSLLFAVIGFLSPANRGSLMTATLFLFTFMGLPGGYMSARVYDVMGGGNPTVAMFTTAVLYPAVIFFLFVVLDCVIWSQGSSGAVPFLTLIALLAMWFCLSVPLVKLGDFLGHKSEELDSPVRTNQVARHIPFVQWYNHAAFTVPLGGALPFGALFLELNYIFSSVWMSRFYYMFGFLALALLILLLTCAEVAVVLLYFQLTAEDHRWWWRSFFTSGSTAIYFFAYAAWYFAVELSSGVSFVSGLVYFFYMFIVSLCFFLLTGAVGFMACLVFVWKVYGAMKAD